MSAVYAFGRRHCGAAPVEPSSTGGQRRCLPSELHAAAQSGTRWHWSIAANEQGGGSNGNYADTHLVPASVWPTWTRRTWRSTRWLACRPTATVPRWVALSGTVQLRPLHVIANYAGNSFYYTACRKQGPPTPRCRSPRGLFVTTRTRRDADDGLAQLRRNWTLRPSRRIADCRPTVCGSAASTRTLAARTSPAASRRSAPRLTAQNVADLYTVVRRTRLPWADRFDGGE